MSARAWITSAAWVITLVVLIGEWVAPEAALLGAVTVLMALGVLTPAEALGGFSSDALLSVAALLVVAAGVRETGVLAAASDRLMGRNVGERRSLLRAMIAPAAASAFLNNTPIVAMVTPAVIEWSKRTRVPPSRLLLPMCYAVTLGGMCTLVGTSSTLVVDGLMRRHGIAPLRMFELTPLGVPVAIAGIAAMALSARRVLPDRSDPVSALDASRREFIVEAVVQDRSPLVGRTIAEAGLRQLPGLFLLGIERAGAFLGPSSPRERLAAGDRLVFTGLASTVADLRRFEGLAPALEAHYAPTRAAEGTLLYECVVSGSSPLVGRTIRDAGFRRRYGAAVIAIHRAGQRLPAKLGDVEIRAGDVLMVEAAEGFFPAWSDSPDFALVARVRSVTPPRPHKARVAIGIVLAMVVAVALDWTPMVVAAFVAAGLMAVTGVLEARHVRKAIDLSVLAVIAGSMGLGTALEKSGAASAIAGGIIAVLGGGHPWVLLLATFVCGLAVTQFVTNSAAAALMFPIVLSTAARAHLDPRPFAVALAISASSSFLTPIGYQTNLLVYGPGGYRFGDFARLGVPIVATTTAVVMALVPLLWPLVAAH